MECNLSWVVWLSLLLSTALIFLLSRKESRNGTRKPPGPPGWPILGNILELGRMPHQTFYKLQPKYGALLWLKLGSVNTLVIQSAKAASELFKNHDQTFCDRKCPDALTAHCYGKGSLSLGQYSPYWRVLRRIYSSELLVNKRINETALVRRKCVDDMLKYIEEDVAAAQARGEPGEVTLSHFLFLMAFNLIGNLTLSWDLVNPRSSEGKEFFAAMDEVMKWAGKPNLADFLPFLKILDPQGIRRNMLREMGRAMKIASGFVKERVRDQKLREEKIGKDLLDAVLEFEGNGKEGPDRIPYQFVNVIILEMFFAGSDTTSSTIEWAMTELLRHPGCMEKTQEEVDRVVGRNRKVKETDMNQMPYLKAVVKETLRLHPAVPLLVPRNAMQDTEFMGYLIPKDTQVLVNVWAIGRDPECWEDPLSFKPERFLGSNVDYKGQNFELIPFGSGRRICVGISLAERVVHLTLATLLHCFDWQLGRDVTPETTDMSERTGMLLRKLIPLKVIPKKRVM